jgi:hypothetical protein
MFVKILQTINDSLRLLGGCGVVEPDQWFPIQFFLKNWKVTSYGANIETSGYGTVFIR